MSETCRNCLTAAHVLRRIGLQDNISWGTMGGPTDIIHATFSNAGHNIERQETDDEYRRRRENAIASGANPDKLPPFGQIIRTFLLQPLCKFYQSELSWLSAGRPARVSVYMAHPVGGPNFKDNVKNATLWYRYLRRLGYTELCNIVGVEYQQKPLVHCPWLAGIEPDEFYPGGREAIIADSRDTILLFDEVWLVGGKITEGMKVEAQTARVLRDLTHLGKLPPLPKAIALPAPKKRRTR